MEERDLIMLARQHSPLAVRTLVEIAREATDLANRKEAVSQLVSRGVLSSHHPTDEELDRIEKMSDGEILEILQRGLH